MATRIWISTDGDMNAVGSWSGGAVPVSADIVVFDPKASRVAPTSNMDFSTNGGAAANFGELLIMPGWSLNIGNPANPLKAECSVLRHYGNCELHYQSKNAGIELDTRDVYIDSAYNKSECASFSSAGSSIFLRATIAGGSVKFDGTATPYTVNVGLPDRAGYGKHPKMDLGYSSTLTPVLITQYSGEVVSSCGLLATGSQFVIFGGRWTQEQNGFDTLFLHGGDVVYNSSDASTRIIQMGGSFDTTQSSRSRTFTGYSQFGGEFIRSSQTTVTTYKDLRITRS